METISVGDKVQFKRKFGTVTGEVKSIKKVVPKRRKAQWDRVILGLPVAYDAAEILDDIPRKKGIRRSYLESVDNLTRI